MLDKIIDFSINNKLIVGLCTVVLIGVGIWSITKVPIDAQPDITNNQVQVITQAANLSTVDIEQFVSYPIEIAMSNLPGVTEIRSISRFGLSVVTIVFKDDMGTYIPRQLVAEKLIEVEQEIPDGFGTPFIGPISTGLGEIYQYTLEVEPAFKDQYTPTALRGIQDWIVKRQMAMVPGVVEVNGFGGSIKQFEVAVNPNELQAIGITIADIFKALEDNNQNTGGAYIVRNHQANFIRGEGLARSIEDIQSIVVKNTHGVPITIKDVASVGVGEAIRYGALTKNGTGEAVGGMIMMLKGANSKEVIEAVKQRMDQIQESLPEGIVIVPFLDRSELISHTTATLTENLVIGGLIVIFVLVIFLGNWRGGVIVASTIPLSLLFAFVMMHIFDVWANLMSLGAIDFGIIVDGAVIIVESIVFVIHGRVVKGKQLTSEEKDEIASTSSKKMMNAAFFGQLIILIVFLPILTLEGVEGKMFKPMALTFIFAMLGAMILCLTYVPAVSSLFLKASPVGKKSWGDRVVNWLEKWYEKLLTSVLKSARIVVGGSVALFVICVVIFTRMGGEFIPELDEGDIAFHIILKPGSSLEEGIQTSTKIEKLLLDTYPEIIQIVSRFGVSDIPTDPMPMDMGDSFIILKEKSEWTSAKTKGALIEKMKQTLSVFPGVSFEFSQPIEMRFNELISGVREDIAVKLYGEDLDVLASKAQEMGRLISTVEGISDLKVETTTGLPQITVNYKRNKIAQYGLSIKDLNTLVSAAFAGGHAGVVFQGERRIELVVRLADTYRSTIDDLKNLYVPLASGTHIPLREVADISYQRGPMQISRENTNRRTYVGINIRDRDVKSVVEDIKKKLAAELELPAGYYIRYGGAFENFERAISKLEIVVPIALILIFVMIYFALNSFKQTSMIYVAIPLAAIGGVLSLWIRGMPFSISAGVGFIVLFGVAVLNGLVLISGLNELKNQGVSDLHKRIRLGVKRRIRPILLTALTDVLGFLPMAVSVSSGAEVQRPLATVVIGGMISSTLLTLFVLPILYKWTEERSLKVTLKAPSKVFLLVVGLCVGVSVTAQDSKQAALKNTSKDFKVIDQQQAVALALKNFPLLKGKNLEIQQQKALRKSAWDLGTTTVFTGGEEINDGNGVYTTIGLQQQDIDIFGIAAKLRQGKEQIALAEKAYELSSLQVAQEVKVAWVKAYVAKKELEAYKRLDSLYHEFERAVALRYEVEAISRLQWLSAKNQVSQIYLKTKQRQGDYNIALEKLNRWLGEEEFYQVSPSLETNFSPLQSFGADTLDHPALALYQQEVEVAKAHYKSIRSEFLPKLSIQGGKQEVNDNGGFYSFQAGLSIPLLSGKSYAQAKAAQIETQIARQTAIYQSATLESNYRAALETYLKWEASWKFYQSNALPLAREQQKAALMAFNEGAIAYVQFTQLLDKVVELELDALDALENYLEARARLEFFAIDKTN